jgi:hypothetical protein
MTAPKRPKPRQQTPIEIPADTSGSDLIGCESNVADGVPEFYSRYFRCTDISVDGDVVVIVGTNLPPHLSYYWGEGSDLFEEFDYSRGDQYRPNPNVIAETNLVLRIPLDPVEVGITVDRDTVNLATGDDTDYPFGPAGVGLDGVALFNPLAAPGDDIEDEKYTFDSYEGHPHDISDADGTVLLENRYHIHMASTIGAEPRGLTPEARYDSTCDI